MKASKMVWVGRIISVLVTFPFIFSAAMKIAQPPEVIQGMAHLGLPESLLLTLAILEISCIIIYLIPPTAVLGAVLLTGYLGGAILAHLRVGESVLTHIILGLVIWAGLFLRDGYLRRILPWRRDLCNK